MKKIWRSCLLKCSRNNDHEDFTSFASTSSPNSKDMTKEKQRLQHFAHEVDEILTHKLYLPEFPRDHISMDLLCISNEIAILNRRLQCMHDHTMKDVLSHQLASISSMIDQIELFLARSGRLESLDRLRQNDEFEDLQHVLQDVI